MDTLVELDTPLELEPFSRVEVVQATNELIKIIKECEDPKRVRTLLQHFIEKIVLTEDAAEFYYRPEKLLIKKSNEPMVRCSSVWLPVYILLRTRKISFNAPEYILFQDIE